MKIRVSEIFRSIQGEGNRTGVLSIWVRFFGCSLRCEGFMQHHPTQPETYFSPIKITPESYKTLKDVPVITTGCDSAYSWDPRFKHLVTDYENAAAVYKDIAPLLYDNMWRHPITKNKIDLCFTGGEPMLQQSAMVDIMKICNVSSWRATSDYPHTIQIETNGTKPISDVFKDFYMHNSFLLNWNVSPKLHTVSGEKDAVKYDIIESYFRLSPYGCLKFVVNNHEECWEELNKHAKALSHLDVPIFVMSCGATKEQQEDLEYMTSIANRAISEGYHFSGRLHAHIWGNGVGT